MEWIKVLQLLSIEARIKIRSKRQTVTSIVIIM